MNKYKKLATNTLILSIGSFGSKILSFLLVRFYTNILGAELFSASEIFTSTVYLLVPLALLSIDEAVLRFILDKNYKTDEVYSTGMFVALIGNISLLVLVPLINFIPDLKERILLLYLCIFASGFRMINQQFIRARGYLKLYAIDGILTTFNLFLLNIIFMAVFKLGVEGYILSIILSDIMSSLFISLIAENVHFISFKSVSKNLMSSMLKYSIPMIPTFILWWIVSASDKYMIRFMISDTENGLYSMATRIPTLISIVSTIFFQAWQLSAITEYNSEDSKRFYSTVFNAYQSILYIGSAGILLFLIPIAKVLLGNFHEAYIFAPLLIIAVLMSCLCQFLSSIYSATKNTSHSLWTSLLAAVNNIVLNLILIPRVGPQGAAFATMSSYGLCFIVRVFDTRKMLAYKVDWIKLILNITTLFIMCIVILNEKKFLTLYLIACFAIIGLLNLDELNSTIKKLFRR